MTEKEQQYNDEYALLADLCEEYLEYHAEDRPIERLVTIGMITAQCANIYNLDSPAGIISPGDLFRRE